MKLSAEIIHERVFLDFKSELKKFHKEREEKYFETFRQKIKDGTIDAYADDYRDVCRHEADVYIKRTPIETLAFVKNYILDASDTLFDAYENGIFDKEETEVAFNTLKYLLVAAEMESDPATKLKH